MSHCTHLTLILQCAEHGRMNKCTRLVLLMERQMEEQESVTEHIYNDTVTQSRIPASTSDKRQVCSMTDKAQQGMNVTVRQVYTQN
jgi:hypothetical protein